MRQLEMTSAILVTLGLCLEIAAAANWVVETNGFRVKEPSDLRGNYDAAIGNFGVPLYGASLEGQLKYVESNSKGCHTFKDDFKEAGTDFVALVVRGECYFVEKAYNAEQAGAKAILVMDDHEEKLLTMAAPEDHPEIAKLREDITIPTALLTRSIGQKLKDALSESRGPIIVELDWTESMAHPDERVEYEFWTTSNDGCGNSCDIQLKFKKEFRDTAVELEKAGDTLFTPHYLTKPCMFGLESDGCKNNCIHNGRYCARDSVGDAYTENFQGWQVVEENKRQLCVFEQAKEVGKPWLWWDFVGGYGTRCTFENGKFNDADCAKTEVEALELDNEKVLTCMADSSADVEHPLMQVCLSGGLQTDECAAQTDNCWRTNGKSACVDTFRGYICQCPLGYKGDGHNCQDIDECEEGTAFCAQLCVNQAGGFRCACNEGYRLLGTKTMAICAPIDQCREDNGGCEDGCSSRDGKKICTCKEGLRLADDGHSCEDVDECAEETSGCEQNCENKDLKETGVPFVCKCNSGFASNPENPKKCLQQTKVLEMMGLGSSAAGISWSKIAGIVAGSSVGAALLGFAIHRWRARRLMRSEIQAIMRQYMPLEGNNFSEADEQLEAGKSTIKAQLAEERC